ncbi:hypothetical protein C4D60_Mb05t25720 [Musa balbisiana]|uniref:DYW domain-containing protein n=1 Tax=Musa balbisiana TaxID=52838 RepID=A0A4S8JYV7_MUSBA|nr:hypothetical protein C4D60_Mb05t25720 [Musa balbisiana]
MRAGPPVSRRLETLLRSPLAFRHLRPFLARLVIAGDVRHPATLRRLSDLIALFPDHPSSPLLSRALSRLYFHLAPSCTTFLYNLIIRAFSRSRRHPCESVFAFVSLLRSASPPDHFTFPSLVKAACSLHSPTGGIQIHPQVLRRGFESYIYVLNTLLSMYSAFGDMVSAQKLFDWSSELLDVVSWNTVVDGYVKVGALEVARRLFEEMPVRNEVSWSAIINGYAGKGELDIARSLFDRMPVQRNAVTWNSMVSGFARHGLLPVARKFFDEMPMRNVVSWNSMVSGYALNGEMDAARKLFDQMPERDVVSWSCMISGYAQSNQFLAALQLFKEMQKVRMIKPNEVTMVSVLSACAHLAALEQGKWVHAYIDKNHMTLDDDQNLGAALVDMYAKCGSIDIALKLFQSLGRRWADASEVRSSLKQTGIRKDPGSSCVELDGIVYEFVAGSCSLPEASAIYAWLDKMGSDLRHQGYSPVTQDVLLDLSEEDKETWLSRHSEKLALAFALLSMYPSSLHKKLLSETGFVSIISRMALALAMIIGLQRRDTSPTHNTVFLISPAAQPVSAMEMGKFACAVLVAAASATAALAADAPAPGPASASFAVTPAVGAVIGASLLSFFAFYLQ